MPVDNRIRERIVFNVNLLKHISKYLNKIADDLNKLIEEDDLDHSKLSELYISLDEIDELFDISKSAIHSDLMRLRFREKVW